MLNYKMNVNNPPLYQSWRTNETSAKHKGKKYIRKLILFYKENGEKVRKFILEIEALRYKELQIINTVYLETELKKAKLRKLRRNRVFCRKGLVGLVLNSRIDILNSDYR